ncbi:Rho termination factor N-terminal domain-containing protein [Terrisporobacter othiniensis]|nr:Rho termination factor N-terminal domain-containing protein [Terrisporobacter othiniensis]
MSEVEDVEGPQGIDYSTMTLAELKIIAKEQGIEGYSKLNKSQLIEKLG